MLHEFEQQVRGAAGETRGLNFKLVQIADIEISAPKFLITRLIEENTLC